MDKIRWNKQKSIKIENIKTYHRLNGNERYEIIFNLKTDGSQMVWSFLTRQESEDAFKYLHGKFRLSREGFGS